MAGFQKYPVPRAMFYMPWAYNKRWRQQSFMALAGSLLIGVLMVRYTTMKGHQNLGYGTYLDPNHDFAPKVVKLA